MNINLKAIFFDIDNTLYSTSEFAEKARLNSVKAMIAAGLDISVDDCCKELNEVVEEFGSNYEQHYDKLLLRLPRKTWANASPSIIIASAVVAYHQTKFNILKPYEGVAETLKVLYESKKWILGIISAGLSIKQAEKLVRLGLHSYIHPQAFFITEALGVNKPNPKLYLIACQKLGLSPSECMFVGDNPKKDIDPANSIGMITVLNQRSEKYRNTKGKSKPTYTITEMNQLLDILKKHFSLTV